jgi:hypothetical protein
MDADAVIEATEQALTKTFTADELQAMSDFNSTPNGKSISKKLASYMNNIMPTMKLEAAKAAQAAAQEMKKGQDDR